MKYINISAADGKLIYAQKINIQQGMNMQTINTASFGKGIYFVRITDGDKQTVLKFLKE